MTLDQIANQEIEKMFRFSNKINSRIEYLVSSPFIKDYVANGTDSIVFKRIMETFNCMIRYSLPGEQRSGSEYEEEPKPEDYLDYIRILDKQEIKSLALRFPDAQPIARKTTRGALKLAFYADLKISANKLKEYLSIIKPWTKVMSDQEIINSVEFDLEYDKMEMGIYEDNFPSKKVKTFSEEMKDFMKDPTQNYFHGHPRKDFERMSEDGRTQWAKAMDTMNPNRAENLEVLRKIYSPNYRKYSSSYDVKMEFLKQVLSPKAYQDLSFKFDQMKGGITI